MQNGIESILKKNPLIPVVTINEMSEIDTIADKLTSQGVSCIEITLRTPIAWDAIREFQQRYGSSFDVGVGTIVSVEDIEKAVEAQVDFIVSPGCSPGMVSALNGCGIPFLPGIVTPSEIITGLEAGWRFFKFFPANLYGGIDTLKAYGQLFSEAKFCPTGGITNDNKESFLALDNVVSVGGSWMTK